MSIKTIDSLALANVKTVASLAIASVKAFNGVTTGFSPTDISGCQLWLDASDVTSIVSSAGLVSRWNDKSGNSNNATASGTARPTTGTRVLNNLNVLDFDGTNNYMSLASAITGGVFSIYFVALVDSLSANPRDIVSSSLAGGAEIRFGNSGANGAIQVVRRSQAVLLTSSSNNSASTAYSFIVTTSNSGNAVYKKGVLSGSNATSASYTQGIDLIAASSSVALLLDGILAEVAIYNKIISAGEINSLNTYSVAKWAIP